MDETHDLSALYVVDALDELERRRFEAHLGECADCQAEVELLDRGLEAYVSAGAEPAPAALKPDVMAAIERETARPTHRNRTRVVAGLTAVAAAVALVVAFGLVAGDPADDVITAEDAVVYQVDDSPYGDTSIVFSAELSRAVFMAAALPDPGEGRTYQLWLIGDDGPASAGTFLPADGQATVLLDGDAVPGLTVGLTIEPAGGSDAPTGDVLIAEALV